MEYEGYSEVHDNNSPTLFSKKEIDETMKDARGCLSARESSSTITNEIDMISGICNNDEVKTLNPAEPTYRFNNRKGQGSNLTISSSNYCLLTQGKTLKFYNVKLGSVMEVRISNKVNEQATENGQFQSQERVGPMHGAVQSSLQEVKQVKQDTPEDVHSEVGSCVTSYDDRQNSIEDGVVNSSPTIAAVTNIKLESRDQKKEDSAMGSQHNIKFGNISCGLYFNSTPLTKQKHNLKMEARKKTIKILCKARITGTKQKSSTHSTHPFVMCRYQVGMKRKTIGQQSGVDQRPRKRSFFESTCNIESSNSGAKSSVINFVKLCTNNCMKWQGNLQETVDDVHKSESVNPCTGHYG